MDRNALKNEALDFLDREVRAHAFGSGVAGLDVADGVLLTEDERVRLWEIIEDLSQPEDPSHE